MNVKFISFKTILFGITLLFLSNKTTAQKELNHWLTTGTAHITFENDTASFVNQFVSFFSGAGMSCISNQNGNLLMFCSFEQIYDASYYPMQNGYGLHGGITSTQNIIIPKPGNPNHYYVVVTPFGSQYTNYATYSEVDMNLNGGLGAVTNIKNVNLGINGIASTGKVTATYHANGKDIWLMIHGAYSNIFFAFLVTEDGISDFPAVSYAGINHLELYPNQANRGEMKFSPDGKRLAAAVKGMNTVQLFDFNNNTGIVSNPISFTNIQTPKSVEFSMDGTVLYYSNDNVQYNCACPYDTTFIFQADLLAGDTISIINSTYPVFWYSDSNAIYNYGSSALQLAINGSIYVIHETGYGDSLFIIKHPELVGNNCEYGFCLEIPDSFGGQFHKYLPNFFRSYLDRNILTENICFGDSTLLFTETNLNFDSIRWEFLDSASLQFVSVSNQDSIYFVFSEPSDYEIQLYRYRDGNEDMTKKWIYILPVVDISLEDTTLCPNQSLAINTALPFVNFAWVKDSIADTTFTNNFIISQSGTYWPIITNYDEYCGSLDTMTVDYVEINPVLGNDTSGNCITNPYSLQVNYQNGDSVFWSNGETGDSIIANFAGQYQATVYFAGCSDSDTINIEYENLLSPDLGPDVFLCAGDSVKLFGGSFPNAEYFWSPTGDTVEQFFTTVPGLYILTVSNICGEFTDSILITALEIPVVNLGNDTTICIGDSLVLNATNPQSIYSWQDLSNDSFLTVWTTNDYWVIVENQCGQASDSIFVDFEFPLQINLGNDTTICQGDSLQLSIINYQLSIQNWSTGDTVPEIFVSDSGNYWLETQNACGIFTDTMELFVSNPQFSFPDDTIGMLTGYIELSAELGWSTYVWENGETTNQTVVSDTGWLALQVADSLGCQTTDSIFILDVSAIHENENSKIRIFPNPANDELFIINIPEMAEIFVYSLHGQSISINRTEEYGNTKILDISNLDSGAYFLDICESGKYVGRVLFLKE